MDRCIVHRYQSYELETSINARLREDGRDMWTFWLVVFVRGGDTNGTG